MAGLFSDVEIANLSGGRRPAAPKGYRLPTIFPSLDKAKRIALDLESYDTSLSAGTGPGWRRDAYIVGFSLAIGDEKGNSSFSEYYPLRHKGVENLDAERVLDWLSTELAFYRGEIVGANLLYDFDGFSYQSVQAPLAKFRDIQFAEPLIDENAFSYQLNTLSKNYGGEGKVNTELKQLYGDHYIERFQEVHPGHARAYGLGDVTEPLRILPLQEKQLRKEGLEAIFDLECRLIPMLLYMRRIGQRVDIVAANALHDRLFERRAQCLAEARKLISRELTVENFGKPGLLVSIFDSLKIEVPRTAPTDTYPSGNPSITDEWLDALEHPFGKVLAKANRYDKALETFVNGYISNYQIDGRVHCEFHPLRSVSVRGKGNGTVAGRFSSSNPNLQNIPVRDKEIGPLCRAMFIPEIGKLYFSGDFSQIEYREIVHAAVLRAQMPKENAVKMWGKDGIDIWNRLQTSFVAQQAYANDPTTDFHQMMATMTGLERKYAKEVNFAVAFVMGLQSFAEKLGWLTPDGKPNQKAIDTMKNYHDTVPFVKAVGTALTKEADDLGYTASLLGRRAHYNRWEPKFREGNVHAKALPLVEAKEAYAGQKLARAMTYAALNRYTQMGGGDKIKTAMVTAFESGVFDNPDELTCSLTVHDELDGSVDPGEKGMARMHELKHIMESVVPLVLPTVAEFATGANWAETH